MRVARVLSSSYGHPSPPPAGRGSGGCYDSGWRPIAALGRLADRVPGS